MVRKIGIIYLETDHYNVKYTYIISCLHNAFKQAESLIVNYLIIQCTDGNTEEVYSSGD